MLQFQQDTARHLFRMQILGPDGAPIETIEQMQSAQLIAAHNQRAGSSAQASLPLQPSIAEHAPVPIHTRAPSTTIDELEKEFQRKKKRELEQARAVSSASGESTAPAQRVTGEKVGRNDPCPCGSGKKYKKCHGATA
jgi:preprotein translocase subunit SecA